jgi:putative hydrolase
MKYRLDIHTHTLASGHAYGTIREMALAAKEKDLEIIGFSEHAPGIPGTCDPFYYKNLQAVPRNLYGVDILHGCEINVTNEGTLSLEEDLIRRLDYGIVGIHRQCYKDAGIQKNTDNLIACMKHPKIFFVSHPDDDHTPLDYKRVVEAAKEYHVALEVNNSSFIKGDQRILNCTDNYITMLNLCEEYRVPILVSSDAHDPSQVADVSLALNFLKEQNFDTSLILNFDTKMFLEFIKKSY